MVSEICGGRDVSSTSTSLANLEIIRPIGVVSKKVNGARITARSITMCIWRAANQQPSCGAKSQKKLVIATTSDMDNFRRDRTLIESFHDVFFSFRQVDDKTFKLARTYLSKHNALHKTLHVGISILLSPVYPSTFLSLPFTHRQLRSLVLASLTRVGILLNREV